MLRALLLRPLLLRRLLRRRLLRRLLLRLLLRLMLRLLGRRPLMRARARGIVDDSFVSDKFVAVLLQYCAGEGTPADHENSLVVLFELVHQRNEIAVAADDGESVDVVVGEGHFERVEREVDIGAVLVAARRRVALHHLDGVFGKRPRGRFLSAPVRIRKLGDDFAAFLERVQHRRHVELAVQCGLDADLDVIEIDKHGDL